jgi:RNA-directed DNA polymerase
VSRVDALRRVALSGVTPGTVDHLIQCIASPRVHPFGGTAGHARHSAVAGGAAIIRFQMYDEHDRCLIAHELTRAFLAAGAWTVDGLSERGAGSLDRWPSWMTALTMTVTAVHRSAPTTEPRQLTELIESFLAQRPDEGPDDLPWPISLVKPLSTRGLRRRPALRHDWPVAVIESVAELAELAELSAGQLAWLADVRGLERTVPDERLRNYRYRTFPRVGGPPRVIEAPKARLKEIQRWLLHKILDHVPVHRDAHGFTRGRSVIGHARRHTGHEVLLALDLRDFFASIAAGRVYGTFRTIGYAPAVAHVLTGLCTNVVPQTVWEVVSRTTTPGDRARGARFTLGRRLATPHLPQGAPTSPALANLAAFGLDRRLAGLARSLDLSYSRYADDLTFSGSARLRRQRRSIEALIVQIAHEEGFAINADKTALRSRGSRQTVCGIVVNGRPNITRIEYDRLRALLHNAARTAPAAQNRARLPDFEAHVRGRIAWVSALNPGRGAKLHELFERVDWGADPRR